MNSGFDDSDTDTGDRRYKNRAYSPEYYSGMVEELTC